MNEHVFRGNSNIQNLAYGLWFMVYDKKKLNQIVSKISFQSIYILCLFVCVQKTSKRLNRSGQIIFEGPHMTSGKGYEWSELKN